MNSCDQKKKKTTPIGSTTSQNQKLNYFKNYSNWTRSQHHDAKMRILSKIKTCIFFANKLTTFKYDSHTVKSEPKKSKIFKFWQNMQKNYKQNDLHWLAYVYIPKVNSWIITISLDFSKNNFEIFYFQLILMQLVFSKIYSINNMSKTLRFKKMASCDSKSFLNKKKKRKKFTIIFSINTLCWVRWKLVCKLQYIQCAQIRYIQYIQ